MAFPATLGMLLAQDSAFEEIVPILVILVLMGIAQIFNKKAKKQQEEQRKQTEQRRREHREAMARKQAEEQARQAPSPARRASPPPPPQRPQPAAARSAAKPKPRLRRTGRHEPPTIVDEPTLTVGTAPTAPATTAGVVAPPMAVASAEQARVVVDLSSTDRLRNAMIFHEIFSPPKALRPEGSEPWQL